MTAEARAPRLSIGLPVFNGQRYIRRVIESVCAQTFGDWELVVSDNCSTDETVAVVLDLARQDRRIQLFRQPSNAGIVANFNCVLSLSRGEYFRWIGADDW